MLTLGQRQSPGVLSGRSPKRQGFTRDRQGTCCHLLLHLNLLPVTDPYSLGLGSGPPTPQTLLQLPTSINLTFHSVDRATPHVQNSNRCPRAGPQKQSRGVESTHSRRSLGNKTGPGPWRTRTQTPAFNSAKRGSGLKARVRGCIQHTHSSPPWPRGRPCFSANSEDPGLAEAAFL